MSLSALVHPGKTASESSEVEHAVDGLAAELRRWFNVDFTVLDGATGEVLCAAEGQPAADWGYRGAVCTEVARRGRPEFIEDDGSLLVLALPTTPARGMSLVAVSTFVKSWPTPGECEASAAQARGLDAKTAEWIRRQTPWNADQLLRIAIAVAEKLSGERRARDLEHEIAEISTHLSGTYEEISLLYRLTQNLRISSTDEQLSRLALGWLADVLPAQSFVIQLSRAAQDATAEDNTTRPIFLTHGTSLIGREDFSRLVAQFALDKNHRPLIINDPLSAPDDWEFPTVRALIVAPLCEGDQVFGYLAAINHTDGGEFGTPEASLLGSVGAILGIHCGNTELYRQASEFVQNVVGALTSAVDAKDPYTCGHSDRVARVALRLAEEMGCSESAQSTIYMAGLLHDVGKIGIEDSVLRKTGRLTEAEYEHIKTHSEIGYRILKDLKQLEPVLPVVLHHHEQWDGGGYPHGLAAEEIPLLARIVAVADASDAMGSDRPYRKGMPEEQVDAVLRKGAGQQWDADVVAAFFRVRDDIRRIGGRARSKPAFDVQQWL